MKKLNIMICLCVIVLLFNSCNAQGNSNITTDTEAVLVPEMTTTPETVVEESVADTAEITTEQTTEEFIPETTEPAIETEETTTPVVETEPTPETPAVPDDTIVADKYVELYEDATYFSSLAEAMTAVSNLTTTGTASTDTATACVEWDKYEITVHLIRDEVVGTDIVIPDHVTLMIEAKLTLDGASIVVPPDVNATIISSDADAKIEKISNNTHSNCMIANEGTLVVMGGTLVMNMDADSATVMENTGDLTVMGVNIHVQSELATAIGIDNKGDLNLQESSIKARTHSGSSYGLYAVRDEAIKAHVINIDGSFIETTAHYGTTKAFLIMGFEHVRVACTVSESVCVEGVEAPTGVEVGLCEHVVICDSIAVASQTKSPYEALSLALNEYGNGSVEIMGGNFYALTSMSSSNILIQEATFSGVLAGLQLCGSKQANIIGGEFEGAYYGGMCISNASTYIRDCTLRATRYDALDAKLALVNNANKVHEVEGPLYATMFIESLGEDNVNVHMDNCQLVEDAVLGAEYAVVISCNNGTRVPTLYVSNMNVELGIYVETETTEQGMLYAGQNAIITEIKGNVLLDSTTYSGAVFRECLA